ncbi:MAG: hypothetical protein Q8R44_13650 [Novosphingobium sp.]|nr:hypothetical protein [Novosphingobium sp.]
MMKFLTGAAAIALAASAVSADPGGGKGNDNAKGGGGDHSAHAQASPDKGNRGGASDKSDAKQNRGKDNAQGRESGKSEFREARGNGRDDRPAKFDNARDIKEAKRQDNRRGDDFRGSVPRSSDARIVRDDRTRFDWDDVIPVRSRGLVDGCPPGLAKKNNGCLPPGQARKAGLAGSFIDRPDWWDFDERWHDGVNWNDGRYGYYNGYMVRYGDNGIQSWLPLLGGALAPGNLWPNQFQSVDLPAYYEDYYGLGSPDGYRYYDDTLFRVDPQNNAITSIAALLTGNSLNVGQRMPQGYEVYNVPYSYRDRYVDGPDANYRYSDGYVYEVDPTTQLVQAAIQLLT